MKNLIFFCQERKRGKRDLGYRRKKTAPFHERRILSRRCPEKDRYWDSELPVSEILTNYEKTYS